MEDIEIIDPQLGLTEAQAAARPAAGDGTTPGRTEKEIVLTHIFTFFNGIFALLAALLLIAGSSLMNILNVQNY